MHKMYTKKKWCIILLYKLFLKRQNWYVLFRDLCLYGQSNNGKQESDYPNSQDSDYILREVGIKSNQIVEQGAFWSSCNVPFFFFFFTYFVSCWYSLCDKNIEHDKNIYTIQLYLLFEMNFMYRGKQKIFFHSCDLHFSDHFYIQCPCKLYLYSQSANNSNSSSWKILVSGGTVTFERMDFGGKRFGFDN